MQRGGDIVRGELVSKFILFFKFQMKRLIQRAKGSNELEVYERFAAGSSAGAISQTIIYPMEVRSFIDRTLRVFFYLLLMYDNIKWFCECRQC